MNSKLMKASVAGAAVVALAAGGGTYAAYSDFGGINGNSVGAGILKLDVSTTNGSSAAVNWGSLAPGQQGVRRAIFLASSDGQSVPTADLYMTVKSLVNHENGCDSRSEAQAEDSTLALTGTEDPASLNCGSTVAGNNNGELSKALDFRINTYPATSADTCKTEADGAIDPATGKWSSSLPTALKTDVLGNAVANLDSNLDKRILISDPAHPLQPGQGVCMIMGSWFAGKAPSDTATYDISHSVVNDALDNAAQGDSLTFDLHFDLVQSAASFN